MGRLSASVTLAAALFVASVGASIGGGARTAEAASKSYAPAQKHCGFRNSIWWLVQEASLTVDGQFHDTDAVGRTKASRDQYLWGKLSQYHYPKGWYYFEYVYDQFWSDMWSAVYWNVLEAEENDLDLYWYYSNEEHKASEAAYRVVPSLWWAVKHTC